MSIATADILTLLAIAMPALCVLWIARLALARARPRDYVFPLVPIAVIALAAAVPAESAAGTQLRSLIAAGAVVWGLLTLVWLASLAKRDSSIMDIFYAAVVVVFAWTLAARHAAWSPHELAALGLVTLWGARLSGYLAWRNLPHGEDPRYAKWRARFGPAWWWWSYFQVFLLQGVLVWLWALPLGLALLAPGPPAWNDALAAAVFAIGFAFQALGDWQLARFKADPANRGRLLTTGVWSLTRHPNYFGEALIWWSFWCLALSHPFGWATIVMPLWVTWFMARDSATPMLERYLMKTKPGYAEYAARVPAFVPWTRP